MAEVDVDALGVAVTGDEEADVSTEVDDEVGDDDDEDDAMVVDATRIAGAGPWNGSVQLKVLSAFSVQHCHSDKVSLYIMFWIAMSA